MILLFYNDEVLQEMMLPNVYDCDYPVRLPAAEFKIRRDVLLRLEKKGSDWEVLSSDDLRIIEDNLEVKNHLLQDGDIVTLLTKQNERLFLLTSEAESAFRQMEKYNLQGLSSITIGSSSDNMISYSFLSLVSSRHLRLTREGRDWYVRDLSTNGSFCNHRRIRDTQRLNSGDTLDLFGLHLILMGDILLIGSNCGTFCVQSDELQQLVTDPIPDRETLPEPKTRENVYFNRSPRNLPVLYSDTLEIEAPPQQALEKRRPAYLVIGPAFTMAIPMFLGCMMMLAASQMQGRSTGIFMYTGMVTALGAAVVGTIWAILNLNYSQEESQRKEELRFNSYSNYLVGIAEELRMRYQHNTNALASMYPSASECMTYDAGSPELWNRNYTHEDYLFVRLGIGDRPFQSEIKIPKDRFTLIHDTLTEKPASIQAEYRLLRNVPVGLKLSDYGLIGLIGGKNKYGAIKLMHIISAQLAATHCYTDVKMVYIYDEENLNTLDDFECMRNYPHVWSEDKSFRYMAANDIEIRDVFFELTNILRTRAESASAPGIKTKAVRPHYFLFLQDPSAIEDEALAKYLFEAKPENGITAFLMVETIDQLPNSCEMVIENDPFGQRFFNLLEVDRSKWQVFTPDDVSTSELEHFGRILSNIEVRELESVSGIPSSIGFLELYGARNLQGLNIQERWRKNRNYNSMKVPIGKKAGDAVCYLDIHEKYHGPHGLVAGTTGSGKSETLQTYILSLAVNFSPEDVSFFIIDFKGGGMANLFDNLPHLAGKISNLSGNQVRRAMISIKSENTRRQRIFASVGVNNINLYTRLYKNHEADIPIPHLFIIIDEFAELKREEPEFMQELISVAQVGRSLGVHLILATQKPSGTVDDNIWSNSKFRLCLRVQDRQDSMDMLHRPDAAFLTQAGRGYLQVGNDELFELFQSGYSGGVYRDNSKSFSTTSMISRTGKADLISISAGNRQKEEDNIHRLTELDAVIGHLHETAVRNGYGQTSQLWLPVLSERILLPDLTEEEELFRGTKWPEQKKGELKATIGFYDDPAHQKQDVLSLDFAECGHFAVCGSVVSGKSTFLQTMIFSLMQRYTPQTVQFYMVDYSSHMLTPFAGSPHTGGVVTEVQEDRLDKLMNLMNQLMNERRDLLKGGSYSQYIQAYGQKLPVLFFVIDNYAALREKTAERYESVISRIAREGIGYGIYLILSGGGFGLGEIPSRIADQIRTVISLEMPDKFKYMDVLRLTRVPILPETNVKGRGLVRIGEQVLEFQTALCVDAEDDFDRIRKIEEQCGSMADAWDGPMARPIPEIPENAVLDDLISASGYMEAIEDPLLLPCAYRREDASVFSFDLRYNYCLSIAGKARSGKTNALKVIMYAAKLKNARIAVIEQDGKGFAELRRPAEQCNAQYICSSSELYRFFDALTPEFVRRNKKKQELLAGGYDELRIAEEMSLEQPIFIFIADMGDFMHMIYKPEEGVGSMSGFAETIMSRGRLHHIYFIASLKLEDEAVLIAYKAYQSFTEAKKGMHLGGSLTQQRLFSFQNIPFARQSAAAKKGEAFASDNEEESTGIEVVIPLAKNEI